MQRWILAFVILMISVVTLPTTLGAQIEGFVTETTRGYVYPERVGLQQVTYGIYQWVTLPQQFQPK